MNDSNAAWKQLRVYVARERRRYEGAGTNKEGRAIAAGLVGAYGGVLRMMDRLEAADTDALVAHSDADALDALTRALDGNHSPEARQARAYGDTSGEALGR